MRLVLSNTAAALLMAAMGLAFAPVQIAGAAVLEQDGRSTRDRDRGVQKPDERSGEREHEQARDTEAERAQQTEDERQREAEAARQREADAERRRRPTDIGEEATRPEAERPTADPAPSPEGRARPPHPHDLGHPSDPEVRAMRRALHEEIRYRNRLAQLARLRELAEAQGNEERVRAIDELEGRVHRLHEARMAEAREEAGRQFDRVHGRLQQGRPARPQTPAAGKAPGKAGSGKAGVQGADRDDAKRGTAGSAMHGQDARSGRGANKAPSRDDDRNPEKGAAKGKGGTR